MRKRAKVLIIDDQEGIRRVLTETCSFLGYEAVAASSGENALKVAEAEMAAGNDIKVALVDMKMPGLNGLETLRTISARVAGIKTVLMTGLGEDDLAEELGQYDICAVLHKPFSLGEVEEQLKKIFLPE